MYLSARIYFGRYIALLCAAPMFHKHKPPSGKRMGVYDYWRVHLSNLVARHLIKVFYAHANARTGWQNMFNEWNMALKCNYQFFSDEHNMVHCNDVIMSLMAYQITSLTIVYSNVYTGEDQRKHQCSASQAFARGLTGDRWIPRTNGLGPVLLTLLRHVARILATGSNAENVSIWRRHHGNSIRWLCGVSIVSYQRNIYQAISSVG